jgi:hypothetical protein
LDNLDDAEKQLIAKQEQVWRALGVTDDIVHIVYRNVKYDDFIATVRDFANGAKQELAKQAYKLWGEEKWDDLYKLFKDNNLNGGWPPYNGFVSITKTESGNQLSGRVFDRFQNYESLSGKYASPVPENSVFSLRSRALGVNYDEMEELGQSYYYIKFKISNASSNLKFQYGDAAPWFDEIGGAIQIKSSENFNDIQNSIEILEKWKFETGQWKELKLINGVWK